MGVARTSVMDFYFSSFYMKMLTKKTKNREAPKLKTIKRRRESGDHLTVEEEEKKPISYLN